MKLVLLLLLCLPLPAFAGVDLVFHGLTAHYPENGHSFPELNPGIGLRETSFGVGADVYRNSYMKPSVALHKDWTIAKGLDLGLGVVTGYHLALDIAHGDIGIREGDPWELMPWPCLEWYPPQLKPFKLTIAPFAFNLGVRF